MLGVHVLRMEPVVGLVPELLRSWERLRSAGPAYNGYSFSSYNPGTLLVKCT